MTTWSEPNDYAVSTRKIGRVITACAAATGHWWLNSQAGPVTGFVEDGDLASAQAAADAAVDAILSSMQADLGLVFGPWCDGARHAVAVDGEMYTVMGDSEGHFFECGLAVPDDMPPGRTEVEVIAAARSHDAARRGTR